MIEHAIATRPVVITIGVSDARHSAQADEQQDRQYRGGLGESGCSEWNTHLTV
jgi:hypothetical protein